MQNKKYKLFWYGMVANIVEHYECFISENSKLSQYIISCIDEALKETESLTDGKYRLQAIDMFYFKKTHMVYGIEMEVPASKRTIQRWLSEFIYLVGEKLGFKKEN